MFLLTVFLSSTTGRKVHGNSTTCVTSSFIMNERFSYCSVPQVQVPVYLPDLKFSISATDITFRPDIIRLPICCLYIFHGVNQDTQLCLFILYCHWLDLAPLQNLIAIFVQFLFSLWYTPRQTLLCALSPMFLHRILL